MAKQPYGSKGFIEWLNVYLGHGNAFTELIAFSAKLMTPESSICRECMQPTKLVMLLLGAMCSMLGRPPARYYFW